MSKFSKLKVELKKLLAQLGEIRTADAVLNYAEDDVTVGIAVYVESDGEFIPAADGEYVADDGRTYVVADGIITDIKTKEEVEEVEEVEEALEETPEVESTPDAIEEIRKEINELYNIVDQLVKKVAAVESAGVETNAQLQKVCEMSAIESAEVEIDKKEANLTTKDRNFNAMLEGIKEASRK